MVVSIEINYLIFVHVLSEQFGAIAIIQITSFYGAHNDSSLPILLISGEQSTPRTAAASDGKAAGGPVAYTDIHVGPL